MASAHRLNTRSLGSLCLAKIAKPRSSDLAIAASMPIAALSAS